MKKPHVVVVGGGSAGISAAMAAARNGAQVSLLERTSCLGGKATNAEVGTICGIYEFSKQKESLLAVNGICREFVTALQTKSHSVPMSNPMGLHYLPYEISVFRLLAEDFLRIVGVEVFYQSVPTRINVVGDRIDRIIVQHSGEIIELLPDAVVDCSGESIVSELAGFELIEDKEYQAAAQVFTLENHLATDEAALGMILLREIRSAIEKGKLNAELDRVSIVPGSLKEGRLKIKLGLPVVESHDEKYIAELERTAKGLVHELADYLIQHVAVFQQARLSSVAPEVGIRTGKRSMGTYVLTEEDVLSCRKSNDGIAKGTWPIEWWGRDKRVMMKYFAESDHYHIPVGCIRSKFAKNLFFAGRIISSTDAAIASARVIGTCMQTGEAAGILAVEQAQGKDISFKVSELNKNL